MLHPTCACCATSGPLWMMCKPASCPSGTTLTWPCEFGCLVGSGGGRLREGPCAAHWCLILLDPNLCAVPCCAPSCNTVLTLMCVSCCCTPPVFNQPTLLPLITNTLTNCTGWSTLVTARSAPARSMQPCWLHQAGASLTSSPQTGPSSALRLNQSQCGLLELF